jgi:hypothetical protein
MKSSAFLISLLLVVSAKAQVRHEIRIPDLPGYQTLVCDFHVHSVFSDGTVWPTVRLDEAWRTGLNAIALTDHIEYQPHAEDIPTQHNRPFALCEQQAKEQDLLLVHGAEITRGTPPGHFNTLFLDDTKPLKTKDFIEAVRQANQQGGFVFWNHHEWQGQEKGAWLDIHQQLVDEKLLHGMEIANNITYYPRAHQWCLDKNLTMLGGSDIHPPDLRTQSSSADHRTCTLVFVTEKSTTGIKQALVEHRTAVWFTNQVIGRREFLEPLFKACVSVDPPHLRKASTTWFRVRNHSEFDLKLTRTGGPGPRQLDLPAASVTLLKITMPKGNDPVDLAYTVDNFLIAPQTCLPVSYRLDRLPQGAAVSEPHP